jgi:hypothetical protein
MKNYIASIQCPLSVVPKIHESKQNISEKIICFCPVVNSGEVHSQTILHVVLAEIVVVNKIN